MNRIGPALILKIFGKTNSRFPTRAYLRPKLLTKYGGRESGLALTSVNYVRQSLDLGTPHGAIPSLTRCKIRIRLGSTDGCASRSSIGCEAEAIGIRAYGPGGDKAAGQTEARPLEDDSEDMRGRLISDRL